MDLALPFLLAPVGSSRLFYPRGEAVAARAAGAAGTTYVLSTLSGTRLEDVKAATRGPCLYQLYLVRRPRRGEDGDRAREGRGLHGAGRDDRHAGRGAARARRPQRHEGAADPQPLQDAPVRLADAGAAALARVVSRRRRAHAVPERRAARRADAVRGRRRGARAVGRGLGRPAVDARGLGRPDRGEGRPHRRRCAAGRSRPAPSAVVVSNHGGRQLDGVAADAARAAGGGGGGRRTGRGAARRRHPPRLATS